MQQYPVRPAVEAAAFQRLILCAVLFAFPGSTFNPVPACAQKKLPSNLYPIKPIATKSAAPSASLGIGNGHFFSYALPQGWRVGEDGQFALTLAAPDNQAFTIMVGNSGFPPNYPPNRFVFEKLSALRPENLQIGQPRPTRPITGFASAFQYDVSYSINGAPCRGSVKCHIFTAYDTTVMAMTAALSEASQWPGYANWLPLVADQVSATNGAAFGRRGIMAQNLKNSTAYAEAARQYRDWSQRNWQQVTDDRNASTDRRAYQVRENLGGVSTYSNPFGGNAPVQLPATYKYVWTDNQGNYLGSDDPSVNPNLGSGKEWRKMPLKKP